LPPARFRLGRDPCGNLQLRRERAKVSKRHLPRGSRIRRVRGPGGMRSSQGARRSARGSAGSHLVWALNLLLGYRPVCRGSFGRNRHDGPHVPSSPACLQSILELLPVGFKDVPIHIDLPVVVNSADSVRRQEASRRWVRSAAAHSGHTEWLRSLAALSG